MLIALAWLSAGSAYARPAAPRHRARHHRAAHARPRHRIIELSDRGRTQPAPRQVVALLQTHPRTSMAYRFGHSRVVGSVGYNQVADPYEIDPHEVNSAAGTQLGHPDGTVGAKVSVPF
jgi:hypothetical protein